MHFTVSTECSNIGHIHECGIIFTGRCEQKVLWWFHWWRIWIDDSATMCWSIFQLVVMIWAVGVDHKSISWQRPIRKLKPMGKIRAANDRLMRQRVAGGNICYVLISSVTVIVTGLVTTRWVFSALNNVQEENVMSPTLNTHVPHFKAS